LTAQPGRQIRDRVGAERCLLIAQDSYYKDGSTLPPAAQVAINYDHPDAFDTSLLVQDLRDLKSGRPVPCLTYDHATYSRRVLPDPLKPMPVVILEGILADGVPRPFSAVSGFAGFRGALLDTFRDLRDAGVVPAMLDSLVQAATAETPDRADHLSACATLFREFRSRSGSSPRWSIPCYRGSTGRG
jgi:hypothetical protein